MHSILQQMLTPVLAIVLPAVGIFLAGIGRAAWQHVKARAAGTHWEWVVRTVDTVTHQVVVSLNATVRATYERANADGRITPEEGQALLDTALTSVKAQMGPEALRALRGLVGSEVDNWIRTRIEAELAGLKTGAGAPATTPAPTVPAPAPAAAVAPAPAAA